MPAPDLDSQQIADVLAYLRETFGQYTGEHP
jgi:mono/diheme cytochrome c family protein